MGDEKKGWASFSLYKDMRPLVEALPADDMLKAIYRFVCDGLEPEPFGDQISELTWTMFREKLQNAINHEANISKVRAEAGRAGGIAKANNSKQMLANRSKVPTYTYTDTVTDTVTGPVHSTGTGTVTVTDTDTDTETDTENRERGQGPDLQEAGAAAANAAPPAPASALPAPVPAEVTEDLFSRERLEKIAERNKIPITTDGVATFFDEMRENGWILYGKQVTRTGIIRALRGWLKYHGEFRSDEAPAEQPAEQRSADRGKGSGPKKEPSFDSREDLLEIDGLRDKLVSSICGKINTRHNKSFNWETEEGLSGLVGFIRDNKFRVFRMSHFTFNEQKAMAYLWDVYNPSEDEEDEE